MLQHSTSNFENSYTIIILRNDNVYDFLNTFFQGNTK